MINNIIINFYDFNFCSSDCSVRVHVSVVPSTRLERSSTLWSTHLLHVMMFACINASVQVRASEPSRTFVNTMINPHVCVHQYLHCSCVEMAETRLDEGAEYDTDDDEPRSKRPRKARGAAVYHTKFNKDWTSTWPFIRDVQGDIYSLWTFLLERVQQFHRLHTLWQGIAIIITQLLSVYSIIIIVIHIIITNMFC